MKKLSLLFALLITLSFLNLKAQDDNMKKWMDYMTPGHRSKRIDKREQRSEAEKCEGKRFRHNGL